MNGHVRPWRGGRAHASMAERGKAYRQICRGGGRRCSPALVTAQLRLLLPAKWRSGEVRGAMLSGDVLCVGGEKAKGTGRKKSLPRSPIYRGGVVTGAVTTPPGSATSLKFCGLGTATQGHVYSGHREGHEIFCATHARDLRRREDPAGIGLLPSGSGQGAGP